MISNCFAICSSNTKFRIFGGTSIPQYQPALIIFVRSPILSHTDLACNTSYHFAASRTVFPRVYLARDRLRLLDHVYDSVASIHMRTRAEMTSREPKVVLTYRDMHT